MSFFLVNKNIICFSVTLIIKIEVILFKGIISIMKNIISSSSLLPFLNDKKKKIGHIYNHTAFVTLLFYFILLFKFTLILSIICVFVLKGEDNLKKREKVSLK